MSSFFEGKNCSGVTIRNNVAVVTGSFIKADDCHGVTVEHCVSSTTPSVDFESARSASTATALTKFYEKYPFACEFDRKDLIELGFALQEAKNGDEEETLKKSRIWPFLRTQNGLNLANFGVNVVRLLGDLVKSLS